MHVPEMVGGAVAAAAQQGRVINPMLQTPACAGCQTIEMARASERRRGSDVIDGSAINSTGAACRVGDSTTPTIYSLLIK
jgi:hypothetical protein